QTGTNATSPSVNTAGTITLGGVSTVVVNPTLNLFSAAGSGKSGVVQEGALILGLGTGTLGVTTAGASVVLDNANNTLGTLGAVSTGVGPFTLVDSTLGLAISGPVYAANATGKSLDITTQGGDLTINGTIS